jgi:hypothetical protein
MDKLTGLTELFTAKAASMPLSTIENIGMLPAESFLLFVFVFLLTLSLLNRKIIPLRIPLLALMVLAGAGTARSICDRVSGELIVYNGISESQVAIRSGRTLDLWSESGTIFPETARHIMTRGLKVNPVHSLSGTCLVESRGKRILICDKLTDALLQSTRPDLVVLKGKYPGIDRRINPDMMPDAVVVGSEASAALRITAGQRERLGTFHDTGVSGLSGEGFEADFIIIRLMHYFVLNYITIL